MSQIRFLADADLNERIVRAAKRLEPSLDVLSAHEAGLRGLSDPEVLRIASEHERLLVSHDFETMPRHFYEWTAERESPGLVLVSQKVSISTAAQGLVTMVLASTCEEWRNLIYWLKG